MRQPKVWLALVGATALGLLIVPLSIKHNHPSSVISRLTHTPTVAAIPKQSYRGLPTQLKIPAISVDAQVEYMGLASDGDMATPSDISGVGWYEYGAIPGEAGSSVIAGHVVGPKGQPAVFAQLDKLVPGDILLVVDAKGQTASFTVREIKNYGQTEQPSEVFNSGPGTHLNLVTCSGDWDAATHHYLDRLVVFADKSV